MHPAYSNARYHEKTEKVDWSCTKCNQLACTALLVTGKRISSVFWFLIVLRHRIYDPVPFVCVCGFPVTSFSAPKTSFPRLYAIPVPSEGLSAKSYRTLSSKGRVKPRVYPNNPTARKGIKPYELYRMVIILAILLYYLH